MKWTWVVVVCVLVVSAHVCAEEWWEETLQYDMEEILASISILNGTSWVGISHTEKLSYLMGYRNALMAADFIYGGSRCTAVLSPGNEVTSGELVYAMDRFYEDLANRDKTVPYALYAITKEKKALESPAVPQEPVAETPAQ